MKGQALTIDAEAYFESSIDLLAIADLQGNFTRVNGSWERVLGWTESEITSKPWLAFVHPDDRERTLAQAAKQIEGAEVITFENRYLCKDGSWRWLSWTCPAPAPGSLFVYAGARDVTERKLLDERIAQLNVELEQRVSETAAANRELEAFSYSVSHDLRAPLRAIDGFSKILQEDHIANLDDEGRRVVAVIRDKTRKMGCLIDDLLAFSRLGRAALSRSEVDQRALALEVCDSLRPETESRAIEVSIDALPNAHGDAAMMRQVWTNLLSNAIKYSRGRQPAQIQVTGWDEGTELVYRVKDNGVGFEMQYAAKLFGVFQRLHSNAEFEGTGVGLAITSRIVQRHGGRVWAEADLGKGAEFFFSLPKKREHNDEHDRGSDPASGRRSERRGADDPGPAQEGSREPVASRGGRR
jgi:PAS domain S-box-containing protein